MNVTELAEAVLQGDLLAARQWAADAQRLEIQWSELDRPVRLDARALRIAAGLVELLAGRAGAEPPSWTNEIGGGEEMIVLDPGLELMPRSFAHAKTSAPEPLRRRNLVALPDFLQVA